MGRKKKRILLARIAAQNSPVVEQVVVAPPVAVEPEPVAVVEEAVEEVAPALTPDPEVVKAPVKVLKTPKAK